MIAAWVVGRGGLLGAALERALRARRHSVFVPSSRFAWHDGTTLHRQLASAVADFSRQAACSDRWEVYWAAGRGTMASLESEMRLETEIVSSFLGLLSQAPGLTSRPGGLALASSAGALYGGAASEPISESTPVAPRVPYGREKLAQECAFREFRRVREDVGLLIARISTIYGPGQSGQKSQGLITHIARSLVQNKPVHIYVPLDTLRDYIMVDDVAAEMVATLAHACTPPREITKIVASGRSTTVAEILSVFRRLHRRAPRLAIGRTPLSQVYARRIEYKSVHPPECMGAAPTPLLLGIAQVMKAETRAFASGRRHDQQWKGAQGESRS